MRRSLSIILLLVTTACSNTQIITITGYPKYLQSESIAIAEIKTIGTQTSSNLFELAKTELQTGQNNIYYLPELEYTLISKGLSMEELKKPELSDSTRKFIAKQLAVQYLLTVKITGITDNRAYGYYADQQFGYPGETNSASLTFQLVSLKDSSVQSAFNVKTTVNPLSIGGKNNSSHTVNLTRQNKALRLAFRKGVRKIKEGMVSAER